MPETRYTRSGNTNIAYQVLGEGPLDLIVVPGIYSHLELQWAEPDMRRFLEQLASFSRVIVFDKRGTGMSDRDVGVPTFEERMDDVRAVLDAVGSERAAIYGMSEGGPLAALFAATYPERTTALILYGTYPRVTETPDWPGIPEAEWQRSLDEAETDFPNSLRFEQFAPSLVGDPAARARWSTLTRMSASPGSLRALLTMIGQTDVRAALPTITVPTLVLHRRGDRVVPFLCAEYLAAVIPGARLVALPGDDHYVCGDLDPWLGAIEEFLTGTRQQAVLNRVLATVVFTDIVDSTDHVARLGDDAWRRVLDQHDAAMHQTAAVHFGRVIKTLGDGGLVTFDGPARAVRFAADFMGRADALGLRIRAGVHTGEVELRGEDVGGMAVHIAARVAGLAGPNEILSSRTVKDLTAGSGLNFTDRGEHTLKGVPEPWQIYAVA